jgi:hypothetical protein
MANSATPRVDGIMTLDPTRATPDAPSDDATAARSGKTLSARRGIIDLLLLRLQWGGIQIHVGGGPANLTDFAIVASSMPSGLRYM